MNAANKKILIADDDASIRLVRLSQAFTRLGYQVRATGNAATLLKWQWPEPSATNLIITDVVMPDENVFDVLPRIRKERPKLPVIVMSAQNNLITAVNAAEMGAFDYIPKPFDLDDMTVVRAAAPVAARRPRSCPRPGARGARRPPAADRPAGAHAGGLPHHRRAGSAATRLWLATGESGSGKELVARALHDMGRRRDGKFVTINLAAVPRERVEAELFGKEDGDCGKLIDADGGTLFLDEIGDMPLDAQDAPPRVIDGSEPALKLEDRLPAHVRIIAAS